MKFSEINREQWGELQPYLDTCLLPVTGLKGEEAPWEMTEALERLRNALDLVEIPFRGRTVTLPALHYPGETPAEVAACIDRVCRMAKQNGGFRYAVVVTANSGLDLASCREPDLVLPLAPGTENAEEAAANAVLSLWSAR